MTASDCRRFRWIAGKKRLRRRRSRRDSHSSQFRHRPQHGLQLQREIGRCNGDRPRAQRALSAGRQRALRKALAAIHARIPKPTEADDQFVQIEKARGDVAFWGKCTTICPSRRRSTRHRGQLLLDSRDQPVRRKRGWRAARRSRKPPFSSRQKPVLSHLKAATQRTG